VQYRSVLAFLVLCSVAQAEEATVEPALVPISAERAKECAAGGGCVYVTEAELRGILTRLSQQAYDTGKAHERERCGSKTGYDW
jgi:hypothetical protein